MDYVDFTSVFGVYTDYLKEEVLSRLGETFICRSHLSRTHAHTKKTTRWRLVIPGENPTVYVVFNWPDWLLLNYFALVCIK